MTGANVRREGVGSPEPRTTGIGLPCIRRAEQDWQDARSERPALGARATPAQPAGRSRHEPALHLRRQWATRDSNEPQISRLKRLAILIRVHICVQPVKSRLLSPNPDGSQRGKAYRRTFGVGWNPYPPKSSPPSTPCSAASPGSHDRFPCLPLAAHLARAGSSTCSAAPTAKYDGAAQEIRSNGRLRTRSASTTQNLPLKPISLSASISSLNRCKNTIGEDAVNRNKTTPHDAGSPQ
jgi:hypothetical protein